MTSGTREEQVRKVIEENLDQLKILEDIHRDWWTLRAEFFNYLANKKGMSHNDFDIYKMVMWRMK